MITNFKIFENERKYKVGDYVLLDINALHKENYKTDRLAVIINVHKNATIFPYHVLLSNGEILIIEEEKIIKYLTNDDVEEFKMKLSANKYNI